MRFTELKYLHTDRFDDIHEIKFAGNFKNDAEDVLTIEIWVQDENINVVIMDNMTNEMIEATDKEKQFTIEYAKINNFLQ